MPTQIYHCQKCNIDFEVIVPITEDVPKGLGCPRGPHYADWRPPTGISFTVKDGTGAAKGANR
jgi:hypothetical protein